MISKNNFFLNSKKFYNNLKKVKKILSSLEKDSIISKFPLLQSYEKKYILNFSANTVKKFSTFKKVVIIGMGGSILGTKSIYSFLKKKIKKEIIFFDNLDLNLKHKNLKNSCFVVVSKSGNTLETLTNLKYFLSKF